MTDETTKTGIPREVAEADFERICRAARLKWDRVRDLNTKKDLEQEKQYIIEEIMEGRITVDQEGWPTVITESEQLPQVKFKRRPIGRDWMAMDRFKEGQDVKKMFAVMAGYLGINSALLEDLEEADLDNVQALHGIFLGNRS
jgi:hypothetical protein